MKDLDTIEFNGKTLTLMQDPYLGDIHYQAHAVDDYENDYRIYWEVTNEDCEDESDSCDWEKFSVVRA